MKRGCFSEIFLVSGKKKQKNTVKLYHGNWTIVEKWSKDLKTLVISEPGAVKFQ